MNDEIMPVHNYDEIPFLVIEKNTEKDIIPSLCNALFNHYLSDEDDNEKEESLDEQRNETLDNSNLAISGKDFLTKFLFKLPKPITVVQEMYHIDRSYRDTYYMYFSNQHFQVKRYSRRLSFFLGRYGREKFFECEHEELTQLEKNFIGSCVINPIVAGTIGRTLINPKYVDNDDKYSVLSTIFDLKNEEYMKLDYIINNNSHNEPMLNIEKLFDAEILYGACKIIANMINSKFSQLYNYCLDYNIEKN